MKFNIPLTGSERTVRRFTWLPTKIGDKIYWLEWVNIRQSYNTAYPGWNNDRVVS